MKLDKDDIPIPGGWHVPKKGTVVPKMGIGTIHSCPRAFDQQYQRLKHIRKRIYGQPLTAFEFFANIFCFIVELAFFVLFSIGLSTVIWWMRR